MRRIREQVAKQHHRLRLLARVRPSHDLTDVRAEPLTGARELLHVLDMTSARTRVVVHVRGAVAKLHPNEIRTAFVERNAGIAIEMLVAFHGCVLRSDLFTPLSVDQ